MTVRQFRILVVLTVVAGFLGGGVSNLLLRGVPAAAQTAAGKVQDEVIAKKFVLVDGAGKTRASLQTTTGPDGGEYPILTLVDDKGQMRAGLCLSKGGNPALSFYDDTRAYRLGVKLLEDGRPSVGVITPGKGMVGLGIRQDGLGFILADAAGKQRAGLVLLPDGTPQLGLYDAAGSPRAALSLDAAGSPDLGLFKANGDVLWRAP